MSVSWSIGVMPLWLATLLVIVLPSLLALLGPIIVRRRFPLERLTLNNEVAGFKYATLAVIYGVLLAFVVVIVWESYKDAQEFSHREAAALLTIYRLAGGLPESVRHVLRQEVLAYTQSVADVEWPALAMGKAAPEGAGAYDRMFQAIVAVEPATDGQKVIYQSMLDSIVRVNEHRRERIISAEASLPTALWYTLVFGGIVTIGFTYFFGSPNLWAQSLQVAVLAAMMSMTLLLIAKMDYPFAGDVRVQPDAFIAAAEKMRDLGGAPAPGAGPPRTR